MKVSKAAAFVVAPLSVFAITALALPALAAEQPTATIKKTVQNQTTNSPVGDANDAASAVSVKTGDILKYVITITNNAPAEETELNLTSGRLTDTLPAGVQLVSDPAKRQITEDLGTIKPGATVTKQFLVKVTAGKDGETVTNKACFTGKYTTAAGAQNGCDNAVIQVGTVQAPTPSPEPAPVTPAPTTPAPTPTPDEDLPTTGPVAIVAPIAALFAIAFTYAARMFVFTREEQL